MPLPSMGLSHVALRVTDLARAKRFYTEVLGFPAVLESGDIVAFNVGGTLLAMRADAAKTPRDDRFDPHRVGLDHLALAVADAADLQGLKSQLDAAQVPNNGIEKDTLTGGSYISFYDPDGIAWELYVLPAS